ncbi:hypothetical protein Tco_0010571 [Tanacetum coccineum]
MTLSNQRTLVAVAVSGGEGGEGDGVGCWSDSRGGVVTVGEGGGGGVELVTRMAAGVWGSDDGDGHEGGVMVAAVGRQPEEVEARGGEWIWGSGRSGHEDNIWFRPECWRRHGGRRPAGRVAGNLEKMESWK